MSSTDEMYNGRDIAVPFKMKDIRTLKRNLPGLKIEHIHTVGRKWDIIVAKEWVEEWKKGKRFECDTCNGKVAEIKPRRKVIG